MEKEKVHVRVVFRKFNDGGDIIALFFEEPSDYNGYYCDSYQHVGQHSGADYSGIVQVSKPAKPEEYKSLVNELNNIGYELEILLRANKNSRNVRVEKARRS